MSSRLDKMLQIAEGIEKGSGKAPSSPQQRVMSPQARQGLIETQVSNLDRMVYGEYIPSQEEKEAWNADKGYDALKEMQNRDEFANRARQTNMPAAIVESMIQNPCNYTPEMLQESRTPVDVLAAKLGEKYGKSAKPQKGIDNVRNIMGRLDEEDNKKKNVENTAVATNIDYSLIKTIVESVVDSRLSSLQQLNESKGNVASNIKLMQLTESGSFRFLDTNDNVYECKMTYLGKKKKKK